MSPTDHQELEKQRRRKLEKMWADGLSEHEIGKKMGWKTKAPGTIIAVYRSRGYDLPRRK